MNKKIAIVTSIIGAYDNQLLEIEYDKSKYDFICFTNLTRLVSNTWDMQYVEDLQVPNSNAKSSYYYKWNPHKYLDHDSYDIMVWVDSSIIDLNMDKLEFYINKHLGNSTSLFIEKHPTRNSLIDELNANCMLNKDDTDIMTNQVNAYFDNGYSDEYTIMVETGFSIRNYKDENLIQFSESIWNEMKPDGHTKRDQLVYDYCMWKTKFDDYSLLTFSQKSEILHFSDHPNKAKYTKKLCVVGPWLGDPKYEDRWVRYVQHYLGHTPVDDVVVGCRPGREFMYDDIHPTKFIISDPNGTIDGCKLDGCIPSFRINSTTDNHIIKLPPIPQVCIPNDIHLLWWTDNAQEFNNMYLKWMRSSQYQYNIIPHIIVPSDDVKQELNILSKYIIVDTNATNKNIGIYLLTSTIECDDIDDVIIVGDNNINPMDEWDKHILYHSSTDKVLIVNDGIERSYRGVITLPIMTYGALKRLNRVIYHPLYSTDIWSPNEFFDNALGFDMIKNISQHHSDIKFELIENIDEYTYNIEQSIFKSETSIYSSRHNMRVSDRLLVDDIDYKKIKFKIYVTGWKVEKYISRCLESIKRQVDVDWECQVVLDPSDDDSYKIAKSYENDKIKVTKNRKRHGVLHNALKAVKLMKPDDDDVIVCVDGDDWLFNENSLKIIANNYLNNKELLVTYGNFIIYEDGEYKLHPLQVYTKDLFDHHRDDNAGFRASHLRTMKYKVWKNIKDTDLRDADGNYFMSSNDIALMYPALEMAGFNRFIGITDPLYVYNRETLFNCDKGGRDEQLNNQKYIYSKERYDTINIKDNQ